MTVNDQAISRRGFLAGIGAACTAACATRAAAAPPPPAPASARMSFGLATYTWGKDWDIPALIAHCTQAGVHGVELRTSANYAHGVEVTLDAARRAEVRKRFADSPVRVVSLATSERMDWPEPDRLRAAIESAKAHLILSHDIGCDVVRVFPNQFHKNVPREKTIEQIARAVDELGGCAGGLGQEVSLEAHGPAGELTTMRAVMDRVTQRTVRIRLNCDRRDTQGAGFAANFDLVKEHLSRVIHLHDLADPDYPYQLMVDLLVKMNWTGWALAERGDAVPDRVQAMADQRRVWETMIEKGRSRA